LSLMGWLGGACSCRRRGGVGIVSSRCARRRGASIATPTLPGGRPGEPLRQAPTRRLELIPDEAEPQQDNAEVVLGCPWIEVATLARGCLRAERVRCECEDQLDVRLYLVGVDRAVEVPELDRLAVEETVEIQAVVWVM